MYSNLKISIKSNQVESNPKDLAEIKYQLKQIPINLKPSKEFKASF